MLATKACVVEIHSTSSFWSYKCGYFSTWLFVYHLYAWFLRSSEETAESLGTGVRAGFQSAGMCWETEAVPLEERLFPV